ncbi:hypothetical protein H4582DRAFT_1991209, partial [Lactarius indigo]
MSTFRSSVMTCLNVSSSIPSIRAIIFRLVATSILRISVATCSVVVNCSNVVTSLAVSGLPRLFRGDRDAVFHGSSLSSFSKRDSFRFALTTLTGVVIRSSTRFPRICRT